MKASIITIGDELLIGQTIDTNSAWMGSELTAIGFDVVMSISIHDRREDILKTLANAGKSSDVVLITGGLGPTNDDITKEVLCEYFGTRLVMNERVLGMIKTMLSRRNFPLNENNRSQAEVPESCRVLENIKGTAPGMWFEKENTIYVSLPGVPYEMKHLMAEYVIPELRSRFTTQAIIHKNIMTYGIPEAVLAEKLTAFEARLPGNMRLAYLPSSGVIKLRLTATGNDRQSLQQLVDGQVQNMYAAIAEHIYAEDEEPLEKTIGKLLHEKGFTVCTAESCTGGNIAHLITGIPGSSAYFTGSVVAYSNTIKTKVLGVPPELIGINGAVSLEVASEMAAGARLLFNTDFAVATTGIAGPDGGSIEKPVGTIWTAVASRRKTTAEKHVFGTERETNIMRFSLAALNLLRREILAG